MAQSPPDTFHQLCEYVRETALLVSASALLQWDERTLLPPRGGEYRAEQVALLAGLIHARQTDPQLRDWLHELDGHSGGNEATDDQAVAVRELRRQYKKQTKLPRRLVEELSRAAVLGQQKWSAARQCNDFATFAPQLKKILNLKREQAAAIGYEECAYDVLLDDFEPLQRTSEVTQVLSELRESLVPLVAAIQDSPRAPNRDILTRDYPVGAQAEFGRRAAHQIGFDFERGRLDETDHPFCSSMGPHDCRITTRYEKNFFPMAFFGTLHEAGHGMYDQGLRNEWYGLPPGSYVSLGVHESQSRLWENFVGRNQPFWRFFFPLAQKAFPLSLESVGLDDFYFAINDVRPSMIRVEADEVTYNLHIIVRFELEQALIDGNLSVRDLPAAWNDLYRKYLGIEPTNDAEGVLQDIHWSAALFGYFPTYSLGNLYAAQLFERALADLRDLDTQFEQGEFQPLLEWLRTNVYRWGKAHSAAELVKRVAGSPISHQPLVRYLYDKLGPLYGIEASCSRN